MDAEIAWYLGACVMAWCLGWGAGSLHTKLVQVLESTA